MMKGAVSFEDILSEMSETDQAEIKARSAEIKRAETLADVREAAMKKQSEVAGMSQTGVSRLEGREDWLVSSLNTYVRGMGGVLKIVAELPGVGIVELPLDSRGKIVDKKETVRARTVSRRRRSS